MNCSACGNRHKHLQTIGVLCHIETYFNGHIGVYVDEHMNRVSGREVKQHLCNNCYNKVMVKLATELRAIQEENGIPLFGEKK